LKGKKNIVLMTSFCPLLLSKVVTLKPGRFFEETGTAYLSRAHGFTLMPFSFSCEVHVTQLFSFIPLFSLCMLTE
jgi:hypothetical protein